MSTIYTDEEFLNLIAAIENKQVFKKTMVNGEVVEYDFSKEIFFDFSDVVFEDDVKPDLITLMTAINKNKNIVGINLENTEIDNYNLIEENKSFIELLLKNKFLRELTPPKNLIIKMEDNISIQNNLQDAQERHDRYIAWQAEQTERAAKTAISNPKVLQDTLLIGKIEDLLASNDPEHFKLAEQLLATLPSSNAIKKYYGNYAEFIKTQKEREEALDPIDQQTQSENNTLQKTSKERLKIEKEISTLSERRFELSANKTKIILDLSRTNDRAQNNKLMSDLENIEEQLREISTKEPELSEKLTAIKQTEQETRAKLLQLKSQQQNIDEAYQKKLAVLNDKFNSFFSSPPYTANMNSNVFPSHAYLKGHFLSSGWVKRMNGKDHLSFEHSDKNRIKEGVDSLKSLAARAYGPAAHNIALSQATSRTPTSEDDLNGEMMQHYKIGMEAGYPPSQVKIALAYLNHLNQIITRYDKPEFSPLFGLDETALIKNLKESIEAENVDAIEATKLMTANIIGAMTLLHPNEILRSKPEENTQMKDNITNAIIALFPLFPEAIQEKFQNLLNDINSTNAPEPKEVKRKVQAINQTVQAYLTSKYPNVQTIPSYLTQIGLTASTEKINTQANARVETNLQAVAPQTNQNNRADENAIPYFEGEEPAVVEEALRRKIAQTKAKSAGDSIIKKFENATKNLQKPAEKVLPLKTPSTTSDNTTGKSLNQPTENPRVQVQPAPIRYSSADLLSPKSLKKNSKPATRTENEPKVTNKESLGSQFLAFFKGKSNIVNSKKEQTPQKSPKGGPSPK